MNEEEEDLPGIEALLGQTIGSLATNLETICLLNSQIREEHKDDMRRIKTLARQNKSLEDQLAQKTGELQEAQQEATRLRQQIDSLEAKLHSIERRKLSELATQVAGQGELGRRFYALAQQIGLVGRQTTRDALLVGFPDIITKQDDRLVGKHIIY